jgi:membrane associated rhomboid family serine protease
MAGASNPCGVLSVLLKEMSSEQSPEKPLPHAETNPNVVTGRKEPGWRRAVLPAAVFVAMLWILEGSADLRWIPRPVEWGILPRSLSGLVGILTSPFIHADTDHLLANTLPLLVVGTGLYYFYRELATRVIAMIWLFSGFWVWMIARGDYHIGASGLIYGFVAFLFLSGLLRRDRRLMAISMLVVFLYGSMVWGILPIDQRISWESHLLGSVAGIFAAWYFRKEGPQRPRPQWELEEEQEHEAGEASGTDALPENPLPPPFRYDYRPSDPPDQKG